jgi:hypothetical protein
MVAYMLINKKFGIPIPISEANVFRLSKEAWLLGEVPVPEGPLKRIGAIYLLPQAIKIRNLLKRIYGPVKLVQLKAPKFYQFRIKDHLIFRKKSKELRRILRLLPTVKPVTIFDIFDYLNDSTKLWDDVGVFDFVNMVKEHATRLTFNVIKSKYPLFITFVLA